MPRDHNRTAISPRYWRSAITNGSLLGVDKRTATGRRYHDLITEFSREIAGDGELTQAEMVLVRQAAAVTIRMEALQLAIVNGTGAAVADEDLVRLSNSLARILRQITSSHRLRGNRPGRPLSKSASKSVAEHFATRKASGRIKP
ncbi:MAG: hypothetical protein WBX25_10555 [Rhodomicrobium sp.]